jgi:SAM-dependent methyltransferase
MTQAANDDSDQTRRSFREKWANNADAAFRNTLTEGSVLQTWILNRNGFADLDALAAHLAPKRRVLDAGCGNGRVTALLASVYPGPVMGIDLNAAPVAAANLAELANVTIREKDLLGDLTDLGEFDFIYCQEVLHHTADPRGGFLNLAKRLSAGGEIAIYVYRVKAPVREFTDDYVREKIKDMPYDEAMAQAKAITELARALSAVKDEIDVPSVPVLGIKAGRYTPQRLIYHFFGKLFWNDELSEHENIVINYDWYHPATATRHTMAEVAGWFADAGLNIVHRFEDEYGITMRGVRA